MIKKYLWPTLGAQQTLLTPTARCGMNIVHDKPVDILHSLSVAEIVKLEMLQPILKSETSVGATHPLKVPYYTFCHIFILQPNLQWSTLAKIILKENLLIHRKHSIFSPLLSLC